MKIVMLCGPAGVGKNTYQEKHYPFEEGKNGWWQFAFAAKLKYMAKMNGWDGKKDAPGRKLLQELGEVFNRYDREKNNDPSWAKAVAKAIENLVFESGTNDHSVVITDARHDHEVEYIMNYFKGAEIEVIELIRTFDSDLTEDAKKHVSEQPISRKLITKTVNLDEEESE